MANPQYSPYELVEEARKLLARDQARYASEPPLTYKGKMAPPKSALTQRAQALESKYAQKPAPMSRKIESVLARPAEGLPIDFINDIMRNTQSQGVTQPAVQTLQSLFGPYYTPQRTERMQYKMGKDIGRGLGEVGGRLATTSKGVEALDARRNREMANTLTTLSDAKQAQRQALIDNLYQFGNQKHAYGGFVNDANRGLFEAEVAAPYKRMSALESALSPYRGLTADSTVDPSTSSAIVQNVAQALRAYGVDPMKSPNQWDSTQGNQGYRGKLTADMPPEMLASHNMLERLSPKLQGPYTAQKKDLVQQLLASPSLGRGAAAQLPTALEPQAAALNKQAKDRLKKDLGALNARYIGLGQYNSPQHIAESERRARDINQSALEGLGRMTEGELKKQLDLQNASTTGNLEKLQTLGKQDVKDYGDVLRNLRDLNKQGATKWRNEQDELEDIFKNYQAERAWEMPHMRNAMRREAYGEAANVFGKSAAQSMALDELANLRARYDEVNKERSQFNDEIQRLRGDLSSKEQYYNTRMQQIQQQAAAQQQQQAAAEAARAQAERDRIAQQQQMEYQRQQAAQNAQRAAQQASAARWGQPVLGNHSYGSLYQHLANTAGQPGRNWPGGVRYQNNPGSFPNIAAALGYHIPQKSEGMYGEYPLSSFTYSSIPEQLKQRYVSGDREASFENFYRDFKPDIFTRLANQPHMRKDGNHYSIAFS